MAYLIGRSVKRSSLLVSTVQLPIFRALVLSSPALSRKHSLEGQSLPFGGREWAAALIIQPCLQGNGASSVQGWMQI